MMTSYWELRVCQGLFRDNWLVNLRGLRTCFLSSCLVAGVPVVACLLHDSFNEIVISMKMLLVSMFKLVEDSIFCSVWTFAFPWGCSHAFEETGFGHFLQGLGLQHILLRNWVIWPMPSWEREETMEDTARTREWTGNWGKDCPSTANVKVTIQYSNNSTGRLHKMSIKKAMEKSEPSHWF